MQNDKLKFQKETIFPVIAIVTLFAALMTAPPSFALHSEDNPGGDQPDESFILGDALYPIKLENIAVNVDTQSKAAILNNGYSRESALFFGLFLPVRFIAEAEFPAQTSSISLLVIPSGGLSSLKDPEIFKTALDNFVKGGGTVFVFSQRFGKDYAPLPEGERLSGYGWLEDQSALSRSALLALQHPVVSGLSTSRPNLNVDGFFTSLPQKGKPILRNSVNGQPVLLLYRQGKGNVIASTLFTDWAYLHTSVTWDEMTLFSRLLKWAGRSLAPSAPKGPDAGKTSAASPALLPAVGFSVQSDHEIYKLGSTATFTINLWNHEDRERRIKVYYDGKGQVVQLAPKGSARLTHSVPVYSTRRIWVYFYDEEEIFLQTLKKGYVVVYPTQGGLSLY